MVAGYDFEDKLEKRIVLSGQSTRGQECCAFTSQLHNDREETLIN